MSNTYRRHLGGRLPPPRVRAVLDLLCRGLTYGEIARELGRSPHTIKCQLQAGYRMLDCRNRVQAVLIWSQLRTSDGAPGPDPARRYTHGAASGEETMLAAGIFE